jgi:hypothetical protein
MLVYEVAGNLKVAKTVLVVVAVESAIGNGGFCPRHSRYHLKSGWASLTMRSAMRRFPGPTKSADVSQRTDSGSVYKFD